jgi:4,5-DOPA dioxygenase extradiol
MQPMDLTPTPLPTLFLSHGSPMIALEPRAAGHFMQRLGPAITAAFGRPKAIVIASAHSLSREPLLLAAPRHHAVYDFGGFDPRLNQMRYDAPGAPELARRVAARLQAAGLPAHTAPQGGLDHGIWTPLRYLFPDADIPVLPLAWPPDWTPAQLLALGQALAALTVEGVLVIGSGSITHNLRRVFGGGGLHPVDRAATPESTAFREWFQARTASADWPALLDYRAQAPHAALMHPSDEHLLPFFVAAGAGGAGGGATGAAGQRIHASLEFGDLGMDAYAFGPGAARLQAELAEEANALS